MTKAKRLSRQQAKVDNRDQKELKLEQIQLEGLEETEQMANDTNMLLITNKKATQINEVQVSSGKKKKPLTRKQRILLEKVLERKDKSAKRKELLSKLATVQVNSAELKQYSSVKDIGKREKRKFTDELMPMPLDDDVEVTAANGDRSQKAKIFVNSIAGSNTKRRNGRTGENKASDTESTATDDMSTDSDDNSGVNDDRIRAAIEAFQKRQEKKKAVTQNNDVEEVEFPASTQHRRPTRYVHVDRREEIKESRSKLPIITEEQIIMEKIAEHDIVIICGETGSGKTTQVPQFLYEAGYALDGQLIGVTEPRRIAAISMAARVGDEMNFAPDDKVCSYQIRYEGNLSTNTKLKFMTDGVLLKEVQMDFLLSKYSVIIIDEAHERSVYTDILIGLLSRIVPLRNKKGNPLKLIIMSATLRVEDFTANTRLFKQMPPVINVESRQFAVATHFNKRTYDDYLAEAFKKVCKIHRKLPEGGILVFVTGQQEVHVLCNKLRRTFPQRANTASTGTEKVANDDTQDQDDDKFDEVNKKQRTSGKRKKKTNDRKEKEKTVDLKDAPLIKLDNYSTMPRDEDDLDLFETSQNVDDGGEDEEVDEDEDLDDDEDDDPSNPLSAVSSSTDGDKPLYVLPLYSLLPSDKQVRVFDKVPEGFRLCVVATNVAETSLTIPNIKYVVDCGKIKMKFFDKVTGVSTFKVCWTSKASSEQRAGRAGRTAAGHCYRLYSSAVYNDEFPLFTEPEIVRKPVEDLILQMKDLGIDRIVNFPFPTPPDEAAVRVAENLLVQIGALQADPTRIKNKRDEHITKITSLGQTMAHFPVNPRYSKMLCLASQQKDTALVSYIICLISALSVNELFVEGERTLPTESTNGDTMMPQPVVKVRYHQMRQTWISGQPGSHTALLGDLMLLLVALGAVEYEQHRANAENSAVEAERNCTAFCEQYGIRYKAIVEARKLRKQLVNTVNIVFPNLNLSIDPLMPPPSQEQAKLIRQIVLSGMVDKIAKRYDHVVTDKEGRDLKNAYQGLLLEEPIFLHPSSVLFKELPPYVCYTEMVETSKVYMKGVCAIELPWLALYLGNQCAFDKPLVDESNEEGTQQPRFDTLRGIVVCHRAATFGRVAWSIPPSETEFPAGLDLYKWFARFLLQGDVVEPLRKYASVLLSSPGTMLKSWAKLQPRTEALLNALIAQKCCTRESLLKIWSTKSDYLLNEYSMWIPESLHFELRLKWPPIEIK